MQSFTDISASTKVRDSLALLMGNDKTALSNSAGTAFPTENLAVGQFCHRTDQEKLYQLRAIIDGLGVWALVFDLAKTALHQEDADIRYAAEATIEERMMLNSLIYG